MIPHWIFVGVIELHVLFFHLVSPIDITDFYPYSINHGDNNFPKNDDGSSPRVSISSKFPFFNNQHYSLYVNTNGAISFQRVISQYTPQPFPLKDGRRVIAPFWADVDIRNGGTIWYRESTNTELLRRATQEIQLYYPSQIYFDATWIFIATWDNVAFFGASDIGKRKRNTFQAVLVTDGQHSFTIFNYEHITWTTGTASQGDADTGLGGTPAQVGFNGGDGINFFVVNQSRTADIINLPQLSNVQVPGKFVFRIDTASIEKGGCNNEGEGTLKVAPRNIPMFGGKLITVTGPCFDIADAVNISFDHGTKNKCVRMSKFSVQCSTPIFYKTGDVTVHLTVTHADHRVSSYTGNIRLLNPIKTTPGLIRLNPQDWKRNNHVKLYLDGQRIPFDVNSASLEVWTVKPIYDNGLPHIEFFKTIEYIKDRHESSFEINFDIFLAILRLSTQSKEGLTQSVWSDVFYIPPATHFMDKQFCKIWQQVDDGLPDISRQKVQECPCTHDQATIDVVRFQVDPNCNPSADDNRQFANHVNCAFNPGAKQCFRLNAAGPQNTGRLCCYDANGGLMDARLRNGGGSLHRRFYLGGPGNIPYLSHFVSDVAPYLACCIRGDSDSCQQYLRRRPQGNCENYTPVSIGRFSGDPHFTTLDGLSYTFNGVGEFTLLTADDDSFVAQVRMERVKDVHGSSKQASVITSFVAKSHNISDTVEIQLNTIRVADVLVNGVQIDFTDLNSHEFTGITVNEPYLGIANLLYKVSVSTTNLLNGTAKEFNVVFTKPSIAFRLKAYTSLLNTFITSGADNLKGNISGLLGNYNGDPNDDLRTRYGDCILANSSTEAIHQDFGLKWRANAAGSLYTYPRGKNFSNYQDVNFIPVFTVPRAIADDRHICGNDEFCFFDLYTTNDRSMAHLTKENSETLNVSKEKAKTVKTCGFPVTMENGSWNSTGITVNSTAVLACNKGYKPSSIDQIICMADGNWTKSNDTCEVDGCGPPKNIQHAEWDFSTTTYNSSATLVCYDGYYSNDTISIYCNNDGNWSSVQRFCEVVECGPPVKIQHSEWIFTNTTYNSTATLACDEGYFTTSNISISCNSDGLWDSIHRSCEAIDCGKPLNMQHAEWIYSNTTFNASAILVCEDGYFSNDNISISCKSTGFWDSSQQSCEAVSCGNTSSPINGKWNISDIVYSSTAELVCDIGYSVQTSVTIRCQSNGKWTKQDENCSLVDCGSPHDLGHSTWHFNETTYNSTAVLSCNEGFVVNDTISIDCQSNGRWEMPNRSCKAVSCGQPAPVIHGTWVTTGLEYNSTGILKCDRGYTTNTSEKIHCQSNRSWTVSSAQCSLVDCGIPVNVTNGSWNFTTTIVDSITTLVCDDGFHYTGNRNVPCLVNGQWNTLGVECTDKSILSKGFKQKLNSPLIAGVAALCIIVTFFVSWLFFKRRNMT